MSPRPPEIIEAPLAVPPQFLGSGKTSSMAESEPSSPYSSPPSKRSPTSILRRESKLASSSGLKTSPHPSSSPTSFATDSPSNANTLSPDDDNSNDVPTDATATTMKTTATRLVTWLSTEDWTLSLSSHRLQCSSVLRRLLRDDGERKTSTDSHLNLVCLARGDTFLPPANDLPSASRASSPREAFTARSEEQQQPGALPANFAILYVHWTPHDESVPLSATVFDIVASLRRVAAQQQRRLRRRGQLEALMHPIGESGTMVMDFSSMETAGSHFPSPGAPLETGIYIVIECLDAMTNPAAVPPLAAFNSLKLQQQQAQRLVKLVAAALPPELRARCHGVACCGISSSESSPSASVAAASHRRRGWPALDACCRAILRLMADDNAAQPQPIATVSPNGTSPSVSFSPPPNVAHLGLVVSDDRLLSFVEEVGSEPHPSKNDVRPSSSECAEAWTVAADWNGNGDLAAFADRARAVWRAYSGLPPEPPSPNSSGGPRRRLPPRRRRQPQPPPVLIGPPSALRGASSPALGSGLSPHSVGAEPFRDRRGQRVWDDAVAALVLCGYLCFHWAADCRFLAWLVLAPSGHAELVQYLREWSF